MSSETEISNLKIEEKIVLKGLLSKEPFAREVAPFIKEEYFETTLSQIIFKSFMEYFTKYNSCPPRDYITLETSKDENMNEAQYSDCKKLIEEVYSENIATYDLKWLRKSTEKWCQERALFIAILKSINILDGTDKNHTQQAIPDLVKDALGVAFELSVGHDYIEDYEKRFNFYHDTTQKIAFDMSIFNKITKGGVSRKTSNCILAQTGGGKSQLMCHFAANYMQDGLNVLYITMEMAEERISERIDANLMDVDIGDIAKMSAMTYASKMNAIGKRVKGRLIVKEYPTGSANVNHFRQLIQELKMKKNFVPDVILVDYLNICASARYRTNAGAVNSYSYVKSIAEELRALAQEENVVLWSATQTNRDGLDASDVSLSNTAESIGLPQTVDLFFAMISVDELEEQGKIMIKQLKNRYNDVNYYKKFIIGVDRAKMKFFDVDSGIDLSGSGKADSDDSDDMNQYGAKFGSEHGSMSDKFKDLDFN